MQKYKVLLWTILFLFIIIVLLSIGLYYYSNKSDNGEINRIYKTLDSLKIEQKKLVEKDSLLEIRVDSIKTTYKKTKSEFKTHEKKYLDVRSTITLPDL